MTPSEYSKTASSKSNKKVYQEHGHKPSLDQEKATPLEAAYIDIYKDALNKLDEVYLRLLRLKRLNRIRHARNKVQLGDYSLIYLHLKDAQIYKYTLTLDTNKKAQAQQTDLVVVNMLL